VTDADEAARRLRGLLDDVVADLEPRWDVHCAGLTGGKDSRILAALPKAMSADWHWLAVSGRDDAEHRGSTATASRLGLDHFSWLEWTSAFLDGTAHRVSADLANGMGAVSDQTLLRSSFEHYRQSALHRGEDDDRVALWIGTLADGLLAGTYLSPPAATIWDALTPRTAHLPRVVAPGVLAGFEARGDEYRSNPFSFTTDRDEEAGYFIRLFTRGRCYVCRSLGCFDHFSRAQVNPYLHPEIIALGLETDSRLLAADRLRDGVLASLGPGLTEPSAFGYRAPAYAHHVFRALAGEVTRAGRLDGLLAPALLEEMRAARFPDLNPNPDGSAPAGPAYRVHADEPQPVIRSLRNYEHLLVYVTFLNLLGEDGVVIA
jgi:hypothetical protein